MAIEIEKKFLTSAEEEARLLDGAEFEKSKELTDAYYDTPDYTVTLADRWLRQRGDQFELKVPLVNGSGSYERTNQYHELVEEADIREAMNLPEQGTLKDDLLSAGYAVFCICKSMRRSYRKEGFAIDIDTVTYDGSDFTYAVTEVEELVDDESEAEAATERIMAFAERHGLETNRAILGKVAAFLQAESPEHYQALRDAKVLK